MNKDSWIALIIASIITIIASIPLYYSQDYSRGSKSKFSEDSDTKVSEPMKRTGQIFGKLYRVRYTMTKTYLAIALLITGFLQQRNLCLISQRSGFFF